MYNSVMNVLNLKFNDMPLYMKNNSDFLNEQIYSIYILNLIYIPTLKML